MGTQTTSLGGQKLKPNGGLWANGEHLKYCIVHMQKQRELEFLIQSVLKWLTFCTKCHSALYFCVKQKTKNMYAQQHLYSPSVWMLCFTAQKASTILIGQLLKDWEDTIHFVLQYGTFN